MGCLFYPVLRRPVEPAPRKRTSVSYAADCDLVVCYGAAMRDQLAGHSDQSAGAGYEHGQPVEAMKAAIEKLTFDGFTLV
jgi:hypothetical protein